MANFLFLFIPKRKARVARVCATAEKQEVLGSELFLGSPALQAVVSADLVLNVSPRVATTTNYLWVLLIHGPWPGFGPDRPELPGAMARTGPARSSSSLDRPGPARASRDNGPARTAGHGPARVEP